MCISTIIYVRLFLQTTFTFYLCLISHTNYSMQRQWYSVGINIQLICMWRTAIIHWREAITTTWWIACAYASTLYGDEDQGLSTKEKVHLSWTKYNSKPKLKTACKMKLTYDITTTTTTRSYHHTYIPHHHHTYHTTTMLTLPPTLIITTMLTLSVSWPW